MSHVYAPYDESLTADQNVERIIATEITSTCPPQLLNQRNPFIHLMAVKNLLFTGKLGFTMQFSKGQVKIEKFLAMRELEAMLAADAEFNSKRVDAKDFAHYMMYTLLPTADSCIYLAREN